MTQIEYNYVLTTGILSWLSAQVIKTIIHLIQYKTFNPERLVGSGGMPSSHTALVCSATLAVSRKYGTGSAVFAIMFILAVIVMYDAMGVRRAAGLHAKEINKINNIIEDNPNIVVVEKNNKELKEYIGHTPFEVLGGALLGILIALLVPVN